jgi:hypothetical protein
MEEYMVFGREKWIRQKYNDAQGADNTDIKGTNHYGDLWRSWRIYQKP